MMQTILSALQPRLADDEDPSVRDNAVGALARLVTAFGTQLPLNAILPGIVSSLPLKADVGENAPAIRCLVGLAYAEETRVQLGAFTQQLLAIFGKLLGGKVKGVDDTLLHEIRQFVAWLNGLAPQQLQQGVMALPEEERAPLLEVLQVV